MLSGANQGRELEQRVAEYFRAFGYQAETNVVLEGRSGGRHEIDVLATKSDPLMTHRVAVECKAWQQPIEKDVVSKLHYVLTDLAIGKGVVVSLGGARSGAERTAADLGIDLWGTDELRSRLGESVVGHLSAGAVPTTNRGWGFPFRVAPDVAVRTMQSAARGRLNIRQLDQVVWSSPIWLPAHCVSLTVTQPLSTRRAGAKVRATRILNLYDGLSGSLVGATPGGFGEVAIDPAIALPVSCRDSKVHASVRKALDGYAKVTTDAAKARHAGNLAAVGLPVPCVAISIDRSDVVYLPFFAGVLDDRGVQRVVAVSAESGQIDQRISDLLTTNIATLRSHFTR